MPIRRISYYKLSGLGVSNFLFTLFKWCNAFHGFKDRSLGFLGCIMLIFKAIRGLKAHLSKTTLIPIKGGQPSWSGSFFWLRGRVFSFFIPWILDLPPRASYESKIHLRTSNKDSAKEIGCAKSKLKSKGRKLTLSSRTFSGLATYFMYMYTSRTTYF